MLSEAMHKMMDATAEKVIFEYRTISSHTRCGLYQEDNSSVLRSWNQWYSFAKLLENLCSLTKLFNNKSEQINTESQREILIHPN